MKIGSRGSKLALWQAEWVKARLYEAGHEAEIRIIKTTGDKLAEIPLTATGTKGLFIKEIEESLLAGEIDIAVHSLKDLPTDQPPGLYVAAVPERADPRDALIARGTTSFSGLPPGAKVGTGSLRRQAQAARLRPDLRLVPVRGNVDTRLKKLDRGDYDALIVAAAGVLRLGLDSRVTQYFPVEEFCPAVGQGALAIEIRQGDPKVESAARALDHSLSHCSIRAERALLRRLGGGCQVPIAAHATVELGQLRLIGVVASVDGSRLIRASSTGVADDPEAVGAAVADSLLRQGAREILGA